MGSGFKTFTAASVLTAADLNNFCQIQSVMYFATTAARDTAITSPVAGMTAYIDSGDANEGLYSYNGTSWRKGPGWNAPWGVLGTQTLTASTTTTSVHTTPQATNLTLTITAVQNRRLKITSTHNFTCSGGANGCGFSHRVAGTAISGSSLVTLNASTYSYTSVVSHHSTTASGSLTIDAYFYAYPTNTAVNDNGTAASPRFLIIEDIGPSGAPV
jgi:hypothetical protein